LKIKSFIASSLFLVAPIFAGNLALPYNTGETAAGTAATAGSLDLHYTAANGSPIYVLSSPNAAWITPAENAAWVGVDSTTGATLNNGRYSESYTVSFYLPEGYDPLSVILTGVFAADDNLDNVWVNCFCTDISEHAAWTSLQAFTLTQGFQTGYNSINFGFTDRSGPGGLLVEFLSATAAPEPGTYALAGLGFIGLGLLRKKLSY
jgi:hypothetical protein